MSAADIRQNHGLARTAAPARKNDKIVSSIDWKAPTGGAFVKAIS
jgi:hypothetical protein